MKKFKPQNREETIALVFALAIVAVALAVPLVFFAWAGRRDFDQFMTFHLIQEWNHRFFGLAKQWNPIMGGGMSLAGDPQVPVLSLTMILSYAVGSLAGIKLGIISYTLIGFLGAYLFAGLVSKNPAARVLAGALFVGNGYFITHLSNGHVDQLPAFTFPFWLWAVHWGTDRVAALPSALSRFITVTALSLLLVPLAVICFDGAPVFPLYIFIWILSYSAWFAWTRKSLTPLAILGLTFGVAMAVDAVYALPMVFHSLDFPRAGAAKFQNPLALPLYLVTPLQGTPGPKFGMNDSAQEYSLYIGPVMAWLIWHYRARIAAGWPQDLLRRFKWLAVVFIILGVGSLRYYVSWLYSPFDLLALLPGFKSIGATSRYWGFLTVPLALAGAAAILEFLRERKTMKYGTALLVLLFLFQLPFQAIATSEGWIRSKACHEPEREYTFRTRDNPRAPGQPIKVVRGNYYHMVKNIGPATGVVRCYQNVEYLQGHIVPSDQVVRGRRGQGGLIPAPELISRWLDYSTVVIHNETPPGRRPAAPVELVLNINYHRHWSADRGEVVRLDSNNLGLRLPDLTADSVTLRFHDPYSEWGMKITRAAAPAWLALLLIALAGWAWKGRHEPS